MYLPTAGAGMGIVVSTVTTRILFVIGLWIVYKVLQGLYNISPLHPLTKIPGPKLAAATYLPEFYHDVILGGRYTHAIKAMHENYGARDMNNRA